MEKFDPKSVTDYLTAKGLIDDVYKSMQSSDIGATAFTVLKILKKTGILPRIASTPGRVEVSEFYRNVARECVHDQDYRNAFEFYNQAFRTSPKYTNNTMLKIYYGRSGLFYNIRNCEEACLSDLNRCYEEGTCGNPMLRQIKENILRRLEQNIRGPSDHTIAIFFHSFSCNRIVHCVSSDVEFLVENGQPKVVASRDILAGTVVALEQAFVAELDEENQLRACHFCHTFSLNLIPCDYCSYMLFCNTTCESFYREDYNDTECKIYHVLDFVKKHHPNYTLSVKAALKLKKQLSWEDFINLSLNLGLKDMDSSMVGAVYDEKNLVSILRRNNNKLLTFGETFNAAIIYAVVVSHLEDEPSFFPRKKYRKDAIQAFCRVLIHIHLSHGPIIRIDNCVKNVTTDEHKTVSDSFGIFSFTSKLGHSCDSNLYVLGFNDKVALISIKPIKKGDELTISHIGHWFDQKHENRRLSLLRTSGIACDCVVCAESWDKSGPRKGNMTEEQQQSYKEWLHQKNSCMSDELTQFKVSLNFLSAVQPNTKEHEMIFDEMKRLSMPLRWEITKNCTILDPRKRIIMRFNTQ